MVYEPFYIIFLWRTRLQHVNYFSTRKSFQASQPIPSAPTTMFHDYPNSDKRPSIVSRGSISSITSRLSTIWPKIPLSSRKTSLAISDVCSYVNTTADADLSPIKELAIRKEEDGFRHEFLLILLAKPSGEEFWMRLERKRPPGALSKLLSSALSANDIVSAVVDLCYSTFFIASPIDQAVISGKLSSLLDETKSVGMTRVVFHNQPSLRDLFHVLEALREESTFYQPWPVWICSFRRWFS